MTDILSRIFQKQDELMQVLGVQTRPENMDIYRGDIIVACMGMASEAGEVLSEVNVLTRPWARKPDAEAKQALAEEAIDVFFYFIELFILLGLTPSDIVRLYNAKWERNMERFRLSSIGTNSANPG
jgi:NTP pyrophosphatase (non-canonical NTP hydrolase)